MHGGQGERQATRGGRGERDRQADRRKGEREAGGREGGRQRREREVGRQADKEAEKFKAAQHINTHGIHPTHKSAYSIIIISQSYGFLN